MSSLQTSVTEASSTATPTLRFGIDLGGSKTEIIALDATGKPLLRQRTATPSDSYSAIIDNICNMIHQAQQALACDFTLGIGIPGAVSPATGLIKNANTTCLIGQDLTTDLEHALRSIPILDAALLHSPVIANDADCFALSEASDGAGAGYASVFAVIIGTGCGAGWVINNQLISGPNAISGEWGHNPLPWRETSDSQEKCYCGQRGCIETLLSGPGLRQQAYLESGKDLSAEDWFTLYQQQDAAARQIFSNYHKRLAKALAAVINTLDPYVIILGGGVSNVPSIYEEVPKLWGQYVFSDTVTTALKQAQFGDSSGVRGAAWLGAQKN